MSSRGSYRAGPERDPYRRSGDYRYGSRVDYDAYDEAEPELASAFEDLDLDDRTRERLHADASESISSIHLDSPIHRLQQEDPSPPQRPQTAEANPAFDPDNSLGLVSADSWNTSPPRDIGSNRDRGSPPTSNLDGFEDPRIYSPWRHLRASSQRGSSAFAQIPGNAPRGYPVYPNEGLFMRGAETALECHCHTCAEHRRDIRRWALPLYQGRSVSDYIRSAYPSSSPQRAYWPSRTGWFYPDEEHFSDSDSEPSSDGSWVEDVYYPGYGLAPSNSYYGGGVFEGDYETMGSDHEYSDNASYTGHERYDGYGSGYYDDDYDDGDFFD